MSTGGGHCRHCGTGCTGGTDLGDGPNLHTDMSFAFWRDGHCPACAEAEEIATEIADLAHRCEVLEYGPEMLVRGMRKARAQVVARGEA